MAHKKAAGSTKNGRDSNPKYLGVKVNNGGKASLGSILIRQRGTEILPGKNVSMGTDHTIYSLKEGVVQITHKRKLGFNNTTKSKKVINVQ